MPKDVATLLERWLRPELARFASVVILIMATTLAVASFATSERGMTRFGTPLGGDYGEFYAIGRLLDRDPAARLYDLDHQDRILHEVLPGLPATDHLPFVYPPFVATLFRPFALLSFVPSLLAWLAISLACYGLAVWLLAGGESRWGREQKWTAGLLALAFEPFAMECWLGGQLSSLGTLAVALALIFDRSGRPIACGLALSTLLYKPTLLVLIGPMLLVGRRWPILLGFAIGGLILGLASLGVAGPGGCRDFVRLMGDYGRIGGSVGPGFKTFKYVDFSAFLRLMGLKAGIARGLGLALSLPASIGLALAWIRADRGRSSDLAWGAILCWSPVLNVYGPIYDVTLVVPGLLVASRALWNDEPTGCPLAFRGWLALIFASSLLSAPVSRGLGIQPLTIALAAMGTYLILASLKADRSALS